MNRLQEHYNYLVFAGYEVVCLMLQGSQNYGLDEYSDEYISDIDSKAIVLPHINDFIKNQKPVSKVEIMENNEHVEVKDIRIMFEMFVKENISYIELLYTNYRIINPKYEEMILPLFNNRETIVNADVPTFLKCITGIAYEKRKALCHPYPNLIEKIERYGYDGKQLSHAVRLLELMTRYCAGTPMAAALKELRDRYLNAYTVDLMVKECAMELLDGILFKILKSKFSQDLETFCDNRR